MRKKIACLKFYKIAESVYFDLIKLGNSEEKSADVMVCCQNYFYSGENGIKFLLGLGNYSVARKDILFEVKAYTGDNLNDNEIEKIEELYLNLLPKSVGGVGYRNIGGYQGKYNPDDIYETHKEFADYIVFLIKR